MYHEAEHYIISYTVVYLHNHSLISISLVHACIPYARLAHLGFRGKASTFCESESGDGARMTRHTNYVILSYCLLDENEDVFSAKGNINWVTVASAHRFCS